MVLFTSGAALGAEHEVKMLNVDEEGRPMQFEPAFLKIEPGDTVTFLPSDPSHNSEALPEMIPEGTDAWEGDIDEKISVTFDEEGLYGYICEPHLPVGMVGLIQVGEAPEADTVEVPDLPGEAASRMEELLEMAESDRAGETPDDATE